MSDTPKIVLNGKEVAPINKAKLPLDVDWQAVAKAKQDEKKTP